MGPLRAHVLSEQNVAGGVSPFLLMQHLPGASRSVSLLGRWFGECGLRIRCETRYAARRGRQMQSVTVGGSSDSRRKDL